jgi:signal peptidase I
MSTVMIDSPPLPATEQAPQPARRPSIPEPKSKSLGHYLGVAVGAAALILMLALAAAVIVVPVVTKSVPLTVLTSSMEPGYPPGTLIIVKPVEPAELRIGDVITYQIRSGDPTVITHRIISISQNTDGERAFTLKGDNNGAADPDPVREVQIQGKLWYAVPYLGWVNTWVNGENRAWIVPIIAGGLFAYAGWMVISGIVGGRKTKRQQALRGPGRHSA